jgi:transposase
MDKAYADSKTRGLARFLNFRPVVPPKKERTEPWRFDQEDKEVYKQRNGIERAFRRIKEFRRIFTRYDKRAVMFSAFVYLALICIISLV